MDFPVLPAMVVKEGMLKLRQNFSASSSMREIAMPVLRHRLQLDGY